MDIEIDTNYYDHPVGYIYRGKGGTELYVKVGTESLPSRSEIVAVVIDGQYLMTDPSLPQSLITDEVLEIANMAIQTGTSNPELRGAKQIALIEETLEKWDEYEDFYHNRLSGPLLLCLGRLLRDASNSFTAEQSEKVLQAVFPFLVAEVYDLYTAAEKAHVARFGARVS